MWDERYSGEEYAYGKEPNDFLKENESIFPPGRILCLAEGEGRNAVFLARQGYEVTAVDASRKGLEKAEQLARAHDVMIETIQADLNVYDPGQNHWDGIVSIFCPLPADMRRTLHAKVIHALKPGGIFLLEAYRPEQLQYGTGGGNSVELMTSRQSLVDDVQDLEILHLKELERNVVEGIYHTGLAAVIQLIARK